MSKRILRAALLALSATFVGTTAYAEYIPKIITGVVKMDSWQTQADQKEGIYQLEAVPGGKLTQLNEGRDVFMAPLGGAVYEDGKMKGIHFRTFADAMGVSYAIYSVEYDMSTWERTKYKSLGDLYGNLISSCGVTKDPESGLNYGIFFNFNMNYEVIDRKLCTIDYTSDIPKKQQICVMTEPFSAIAASPNGRLYGVSREGYFYTINKSNGKLTLLGDLYINDISANPSSMTFDPRTQKLYWCYVANNGKSYLYEINYAVGSVEATKIMQLPENAVLVNMYIAAPEAEDDAPAAVRDLQVAFEGESLTGQVSFRMPDKSYEGSDLTGELSYAVFANSEQVASGKAAAGAEVNCEVTVKGGDTTIKVQAANTGGDGAPVEESLYVGPDTPLAVTDAHFTYDSSKQSASVIWTAPVKGVHDITLTQSNLKYKVVRQPGNVVVASAHDATSFTEPLVNDDALKAFHYEVSAVNGALTGASATTNKVVIGNPVTLPYSEYFTKDSGFDICTVIDANHDGTTWQRYHSVSEYTGTSNYARMDADNEHADDDWLLLPPMNLQKGSIYSLSFDAKKQFLTDGCNQLLEVSVGKGEDPASYVSIMGRTDITNVNFQEYTASFEVPENGIYHIGIHAMSNAASAALDIDRVSVKEIASGDAPEAVTDLSFTPEPTGELSATVCFKTPDKARNGESLVSLKRIEVLTSQEKVVGSKSDVEPGKDYTITLTGLANGYETYSVRAVNDKGNGTPTEMSVFVGQDVPTVPRNAKLSDNGNEVILTWDAPSAGANGLYVNPDKMTYTLYTYNERGYMTSVAENIISPYNTGVKSAEGDQDLVYYALAASTTGGEGEPVATNGLIVGAPYALPYAQSFAGAEWGDYFVWMEGDYADWNIGLTRSISSDDDGGSVAFIPYRSEFGNFNLGKIALNGTDHPTLTFDCYVYPGSKSTLAVAIDKHPQGVAETLTTIKFADDTEECWRPVAVDLSRYASEPYVLVKFAMASSSKDEPVVIDNIRIKDNASGIRNVTENTNSKVYDVYTIDGKVIRIGSADLNGLAPGLYIVNGQRHIIR